MANWLLTCCKCSKHVFLMLFELSACHGNLTWLLLICRLLLLLLPPRTFLVMMLLMCSYASVCDNEAADTHKHTRTHLLHTHRHTDAIRKQVRLWLLSPQMMLDTWLIEWRLTVAGLILYKYYRLNQLHVYFIALMKFEVIVLLRFGRLSALTAWPTRSAQCQSKPKQLAG